MAIGITLCYEDGICDVCGKKKAVRIIFDEDSKMMLKICDSCANRFPNKSVEFMLAKYGKVMKRGAN